MANKANDAKIAQLAAENEIMGKPRTLLGDVWRQFRKHRIALFASFLLIAIVLTVSIGPWFYTADPTYADIMAMLAFNDGPDVTPIVTPQHPLGVDNVGRDLLARMLHGGRVSLAIGFTAMAIAMTLGTLIGLLAGYFSFLDGPLMRLTDMFLALPTLPLLLVITMLFRDSLRSLFGPELGIFLITVSVIGALGWMPTARLVRGEVLSMKEREFVLAARSVGAGDLRILRLHILPNVLSPVIVAATFSIASAIITESALSFLGLGFPPDFPTWGRLLFDGKDFYQLSRFGVLAPGVAISVTVLCVNFIGDGLRDALDPRLRK